MEAYLRAIVIFEQNDWARLLPMVEFARQSGSLKRLTCWRILHPTQQRQKAGALYSLSFKENDQYGFLVF